MFPVDCKIQCTVTATHNNHLGTNDVPYYPIDDALSDRFTLDSKSFELLTEAKHCSLSVSAGIR